MDSELATRVVECLSPESRPEGFAALYPILLRELAKGVPVSAQTLAGLTGQSVEQVSAMLRGATDAEIDSKGNVVGYGITLRETPHVFEVEGRALHTWCALDALMFPAVIGKTARVQSRCPGTGALVSLTSAPHAVRDVSPSGAAVSLVIPKAAIRKSFCCHVHFFASMEAAQRYACGQEDMAIVSVAEAFALGQKVAEKLCSAARMR